MSFSPEYTAFKVLAETKDACMVQATCVGGGGEVGVGEDADGDGSDKSKLSGWRTIVDVQLEEYTLSKWRVYPGTSRMRSMNTTASAARISCLCIVSAVHCIRHSLHLIFICIQVFSLAARRTL
jgi:hypothetical protein